MKLSAVILARVIAYIEAIDLNPRGTVFYPEFTQEFVKQYQFQKFPRTFEEFDESKGVEFHQGKCGNKIIQKFVIWNTILVVESRSSTAEAREILEEMLLWANGKFGFAFKPGMIRRFGYVSDVTFYSDVPILSAACQPLADLATKTGAALADIHKEPFEYYPANLAVGHDPLTRKNGVAPFMITRRAESRYSDNKYFSEAPLPTDMHIKFLEEFEDGIKRLLT